MIKLKIIFCFICCFVTSSIIAQNKISGIIKSTYGNSASNCRVYLDEGKYSAMTDSLGWFELNNIPNGNYVLYTSSIEFQSYQKKISVNDKDQYLSIELEPDIRTMDEVTIERTELNHLRGVEDMGIYEGKKSEVIYADSLVANLSTNNARQVYSRVPGLNIWENDGAGLQLSIGGRGLDPNRTSNFNVRQNGYDISADALGYPESYYTPPIEAVERIQIVRGAASLQYGTQFGGLLNFELRGPVPDKKVQLVARQSVGSYGDKDDFLAFYNTFTSLSGTIGKLSYYTYFQYKAGNGWRPNSEFDNHNFYSNVNYQISKKTMVGLDFTHMDYLAHQPGGLDDKIFKADPRQSNRERNWFKVNWNLPAFHFNHKFNVNNEFNLRLFGLYAQRYSVGFRPYRVTTFDDPNEHRDLIKGEFKNWGAEARYLKRYMIANKDLVLLLGGRYYHGFSHTTQGFSSKMKNADFNYTPNQPMIYDYRFPNKNLAFFVENIINLGDKISVTPGLRYEHIKTTADGYYGNIAYDLAGNIYDYKQVLENRINSRQFVLGGIGVSYKPTYNVNIYGNISQNYRSITFTDMRIANASAFIDPDLQDEKGYSADLGVRSVETKKVSYDVSVFYLNYNNKIDETLGYDKFDKPIRIRGNIGQAAIMGVESYLESDLLRFLAPKTEKWRAVIFANAAFITSEFVESEVVGVKGNSVPFVPDLNVKSGLRLEYKKLKGAFQYTYLSEQFSDATNAVEGGPGAVVGIIPAYHIMDLSLSYELKIFRIEASVNNLTNYMYFTRRATAYPGPGILPSDGRSFYLTLQVKI